MVDQLYKDLFGSVQEVNGEDSNIFDLIFDRAMKENDTVDIDKRNLLETATLWLEKMMANNELTVIPWKAKEYCIEKQMLLHQTDVLQSQLQKHNRIQLYIQIENYIKEKVEKKFAAIDQSFNYHYRSIPEFMEKISDPLHVSDLSKVYLDELLQKISPGFIAMDFRIIWMFDEIEADYNVVIKQLEKGNPSQILSNCYLDQSVFTDISEFLSEDLIKYLIPSLYTYAYQVKKVELYSKKINESLLRDFLKELVIACSSRFTHSYLTYNYKFPIIEALKKSWDELLEYYESSLEKLKEDYVNVLKNLYCGLFYRISCNYYSFGIEVSKVEFEPVKLEVRYDESKLHKTANDFLCAISKIENERKNYEKTKAMKYSTSLCQIVEAIDNFKKIVLTRNNSSAIYIANLHKFTDTAIYLNDLRSRNEEQFILHYEGLYRSLSLILKDADLQNLKTPTQFDLAIHFVSTVIKRNEFSRVKVLFDYAEKMICRYEQDKLFKGEYIEENDCFYRFLVLLARYASDCSAMNHSFIDICKYSQISNNLTNELVETYKLIGGIDSFYNHFQINLAKKTIDKVKSFVKENRGTVLVVPAFPLLFNKINKDD